MRTDDLISLLEGSAGSVAPHWVARRLGWAIVLAVAGACVLMLGTLGIRPDLAEAATQARFWLKVLFAAALVGGCAWVCARLGRPGVALGGAWLGIAVPVAALWVASVAVLAAVPPGQLWPLLAGQTWAVCPLAIALLSVPGFIALMHAMGGMAPTRLRPAGAAAGLLAGAAATLVYCLHCPEMQIPFWGAWYVLGMALPAVAGAALGPRVLKW
ncbi:DUF1109 domain-containing protein [Pseudomonas typographi]|uniref:DUF1109 domain-containing protein n=1 Tax=Pseudomonas typographi TaxID=2715964 RepID=A0ABR7Z2A6_9PSED|nr:DUF1109 domain-containing protein [Pseudomonas typographi]MBD1599625.1 DUF1109 domain-containing protein [Pseudomonas typographi]